MFVIFGIVHGSNIHIQMHIAVFSKVQQFLDSKKSKQGGEFMCKGG